MMVTRTGHTYRTVQETAVPAVARPAGGLSAADGVQLIGGLDGVVSSIGAAAQEIQNAAKELKILNQRQLQMYGTSANTPTDPTHDLAHAMTTAINTQTQTLTQMLGAPGATITRPQPARDAGPTPVISPPVSQTEVQSSPQSVVQPAGRVSPVATTRQHPTAPAPVQPDSSPGDPHRNQDIYERNRDFFRGDGGQFSLGNLRQTLGTHVQQQMGNRTWGTQLKQDANGEWRHLDANNLPTGAKASESEVADFHRRSNVVGAVRGGAQTLAEGGTLRQAGLSMLPEGAAGALGVVGAGIFAAEKAGQFAASQRAANAQWQSMLGGTQADAVGERARSKMFQWSQFGVMGGQDAAALYQGVAATGMNRDQRGTAQDFAVSNYKDLGMSIQDSMDIIDTAAKTGQESLTGVAQALKDVTDSAKEAGVNTEVARQQFTATWKSFSDVMGGNTNTATIEAAGFTNAQVGMGRQFQDAKINPTDPTVMSMVAAHSGMRYNDVIAQGLRPGGSTAYAKQWTSTAQQMSANSLGPQAMAIIAQHLKPGQSIKDLSQSERQSLDAEILSNTSDVRGLMTNLGQVGITASSPLNAVEQALAIQTGDLNPFRSAQEAQRKQQAAGQTHIDKSMATAGGSWMDGVTGFLGFGAPKEENSKSYVDLQKKVNDQHSMFAMPWSDDSQTANAFLSDVRKTHRVGGISQSLAETASNGTKLAKSIEVQTAGGKRVVSLQDAMKYFRDQIDAGTAKITEGSDAGETVAKAMDARGDSKLKVTSSKDKSLKDKGTVASEWEKKHSSTTTGQVTITPSPELTRFFRFLPSGGASVDPAAGWVPPSPHVTANGRPSGNSGF